MIRYIYKLATCFTLAIFFASCITHTPPTLPMATPEKDLEAKQFICPADKARIYVYRPSGVAAATYYEMIMDGKKWGALNVKTYLMLDVIPGENTISFWTGYHTRAITINTEAGKLYFIEMKSVFGGWRLEQVSEGEGKENVEKSKLVMRDYDFIGTLNRQPDTLTYINYDGHIKLTFPNDKWRVYTKPNERLKKIWLTPWPGNSAYHVLWAFVPDWPHNKLSMVYQIQPVKGHRLRIEADISLDEYMVLMKNGMMGPDVEEIDSKVIQRNDRRIGVIISKWKGGWWWLSTFFKEKGRFSMLQFNGAKGLLETYKNEFWAIVDSYEYLE
jgi:hypothetical protein